MDERWWLYINVTKLLTSNGSYSSKTNSNSPLKPNSLSLSLSPLLQHFRFLSKSAMEGTVLEFLDWSVCFFRFVFSMRNETISLWLSSAFFLVCLFVCQINISRSAAAMVFLRVNRTNILLTITISTLVTALSLVVDFEILVTENHKRIWVLIFWLLLDLIRSLICRYLEDSN